jgi:List-Bact-rpt repeat protein/Big-like domain-containing protein
MTFRSRCALASVLVTFMFSALGCGHDQQLVGITIQPDTENFGATNIPLPEDAGVSVQLRALGQYIHPPVTKDITNQVTWASNTPDMVSVNSTGLITATGLACGGTLISATVKTNSSAGNLSSSGAIVTSTMQANVICPTGLGQLLTVQFVGAGAGSVTSTPSGINCAANCSASFASGTAITLTATPNSGSTFGGWNGCDSVSGQTCIINSLTANRTVAVTFN